MGTDRLPGNVTPSPRAGEMVAGRYRIQGLLGHGGFGEVYYAEDTTIGRAVALKMVRPGSAADGDAQRMVEKETRALARLRHPGIVQLHDVVQGGGGTAVLVLEYVPGQPLDIVAGEDRLPWADCAEIGARVCDALAAAHAEGIVHRDIKPSNILIEPDGRVRVSDFGIARLADATATATGVLWGTPGYIAPEVALGQEHPSPASDIYALSAVLYELACGRPPFVAENDSPAAVLLMHIQDDAPDPRVFAPDLPESACAVLSQGLSKDIRVRPQSAAALGSLLMATIPPDPAPTPDAAPKGRTTAETKLHLPPGSPEVDLKAPTKVISRSRVTPRAVAVILGVALGVALAGWLISPISPLRTDPLACLPNCKGANLAGEDLSRRQDMRQASFRGANLARADLSRSSAWYSDFAGADLRSADLYNTSANGSDFTGANLRDANLVSADLSYADFTNADLTGAKMGGGTWIGYVTWNNTTCPNGKLAPAEVARCGP